MNLYKILTIIFLVAALVVGIYTANIFINNVGFKSQATFFVEDSEQYIQYYLKKSDFRFYTSSNSIIIEKPLVGKAEFLKDENMDNFLSSWSLYNGNLFPNDECVYIKISIPSKNINLSQGGVLFSCVNNNFLNNKFNIQNVQ